MKYLFGIQPTGKIHIGNYLGGIKDALELQKENEVEFMIAQFHALTTLDMEGLTNIRTELEKLGAKKITTQHLNNLELMWIIQCKTPVSELQKMTQWKSKGKGNAGLLTYPCLMAADIILSGCDIVLIGEDQLQHFEFYRDTCKRLGLKPCFYKLSETPRIMSIKDPTKKMSKSLGDEHCLYLFEDNTKKIMKAPTTPDGIKNLKLIANGFGIEYDETNNKSSKEELINKLTFVNI